MPVNEEAPQRPVRMVFTSRAGGVSSSPYESFNLGDHVGDDPADVVSNRARLQRVLGLDDIVWMEQLHTNTVTRVDRGNAGTPVEATDAIITTEKTPRARCARRGLHAGAAFRRLRRRRRRSPCRSPRGS